MASLDVKSLFANVPVNFKIDLILNNIFNNGVKDFNRLNRQQMKKLLTWHATGQYFKLERHLQTNIKNPHGKSYRFFSGGRLHELGVERSFFI